MNDYITIFTTSLTAIGFSPFDGPDSMTPPDLVRRNRLQEQLTEVQTVDLGSISFLVMADCGSPVWVEHMKARSIPASELAELIEQVGAAERQLT